MEKSKIKKLLLITAFVLFVILMAYLIWITFFKTKPGGEIISPDGPGSPGLPGSIEGDKLPISEPGGEIPGSETIPSEIQTEPQTPISEDEHSLGIIV